MNADQEEGKKGGKCFASTSPCLLLFFISLPMSVYQCSSAVPSQPQSTLSQVGCVEPGAMGLPSAKDPTARRRRSASQREPLLVRRRRSAESRRGGCPAGDRLDAPYTDCSRPLMEALREWNSWPRRLRERGVRTRLLSSRSCCLGSGRRWPSFGPPVRSVSLAHEVLCCG